MVCLLRQHARIPSEATCNCSILLSLFREHAHSAAMVKHGMDIIKQITNHVNAGQTPVLTVDQPLYAKKIQWAWPDVYGERQFVVMMGGLHIECPWRFP